MLGRVLHTLATPSQGAGGRPDKVWEQTCATRPALPPPQAQVVDVPPSQQLSPVGGVGGWGGHQALAELDVTMLQRQEGPRAIGCALRAKALPGP